MFAVVAIGLLISVLFLLGLGCVAVFQVAFSGPPTHHDNARWQPPLARGEDLLAWAAGMANAVARKRLRQPVGKETARELATEIYEGSSYAMARSPGAVRPLKPRCTSCRHRMIGVTAPEALAIADALQASQGKREVKRIRDLAAANAAASAGLDHEQYQQAQFACPLLTSDSTCVVYDARPIRCRGWCSPASKMESADGASGNCGKCDPRADAVGRGAEEGLSLALRSAGLDSDIYELNSALVASLDTAKAAERWIRGEPVFAGCHQYA
jgi:hypothetical protein